MIEVFHFQPFESRDDTVIGLRFRYDTRLVGLLKTLLRRYRPLVLRWCVAGGRLADHGCWFVEERAWPAIAAELRAAGYELRAGVATVI